ALVAPHRDPQAVADRVDVASLVRRAGVLGRGSRLPGRARREDVAELQLRARARLGRRERIVDERVDLRLLCRALAREVVLAQDAPLGQEALEALHRVLLRPLLEL